ncbi:MAG TPA: hypothetical protein DCQ76_02595 [Ruminococcaceae bacterium]|nr:hypothetical protein [Oscillospiraceae bacterium]
MFVFIIFCLLLSTPIAFSVLQSQATQRYKKIKSAVFTKQEKIALISEEDRGEVKTTLYHPNSAAEAALCGLQQDLTYNGVCRHSL